MSTFSFENSYLNLPSAFYERVRAEQFSRPELLQFNHELAKSLGFPSREFSTEELANFFAGQKLLPGSKPIALAYAGFQFGHPVPVLGDGRAMLLGELKGFDVQLKGSGKTPFSRRGDGLSALGPVVREYLVSEAMFVLGVPTTRALAAVRTGEEVFRQFGPEPGGVFTRVAGSHIRVGTFQYFSFKKDLSSLKILLDYTIKRHYPELSHLSNLREKCLSLLKAFSLRQGNLIAQWSGLGFIHGVMNTDNCFLSGETVDYGPCAFMDEFRFHKVFSSIDERGRYSFFNQVPIIQWNILRLADCLIPLISDDEKEAITLVEKEVIPLLEEFPQMRTREFAKKLGIHDFKAEDESLVMDFLTFLEEESMDFTLSFRNLTKLYEGDFSFYGESRKIKDFTSKWLARNPKTENLDQLNPLYIPRNHLVQKAIELSYKGDDSFFKRFNEVLRKPFEERPGCEEFTLPPQESEKVLRTFCGT